jgi:hypothetical protein
VGHSRHVRSTPQRHCIASRSYIQITSRSGHLLIRRILHHGQHLAYRRHGLDVVIGNAGAVRLSVGGHRAHLAGRPGQVRRLHVH